MLESSCNGDFAVALDTGFRRYDEFRCLIHITLIRTLFKLLHSVDKEHIFLRDLRQAIKPPRAPTVARFHVDFKDQRILVSF